MTKQIGDKYFPKTGKIALPSGNGTRILPGPKMEILFGIFLGNDRTSINRHLRFALLCLRSQFLSHKTNKPAEKELMMTHLLISRKYHFRSPSTVDCIWGYMGCADGGGGRRRRNGGGSECKEEFNRCSTVAMGMGPTLQSQAANR